MQRTETRLRERRHELGFSIWYCAERVGVNPLTWRMWENGVSQPNATNRQAIERLLGRKWTWLSKPVAV